ncbi:response regulator [Kovacikia minuta CCNUW1]|uniref:hybrid sensor histidine kinase/response regulator n=1 Tax=Kovacikia minuta TaxID=2931930 RepID=UPI001CCF6468|nr:response regulator [Kovacikia minuta]UBF28922.1 response regulator [Kovacikia minuta CCNUW1]
MQPDLQVNILLVDDREENLLSLDAVLSSLGENLVQARSGEEALRCLLEQDFAVILLDVQMPGMNGFETANLIRNRPRSRHTPIIFLTAFSTSDEFVFKGYSSGAVDYLLKPIDPVILTSKVAVFVDLFRKNEIIKQQAEEVRRKAAQLKTINTELRQSEERFRSLSACSPVGIFLLDIHGQCIYTNPRCQAICGFSSTESMGEGWMQFIHPDDQKRAIEDWANYTHQQKEDTYEYRFQTADGTIRWTLVRSSPMFSDKGKLIGHVGTVEDITQRKQAEADREQMIREQAARREAEAANRMKDEFLAVLSHELRTPLSAMLGWARLLRTQKLDKPTRERALETIERNAVVQSQLIEDILDVSKIIRGKLNLKCAPINLVSVVEGAIDSVRHQLESKEIQLETLLDAATGRVQGDPFRLQQVIWNLLTNAIKFTPDKGRVEIRLERVQAGSREWGVGSGEQASHAPHPTPHTPAFVQIQVIDTGIGISPDFLPNVFDRFRQADSTTTRSHNGLGLGLAIVRHLVELHGGTVHAASPGEGKGATFTVRLPLIEAGKPGGEAGTRGWGDAEIKVEGRGQEAEGRRQEVQGETQRSVLSPQPSASIQNSKFKIQNSEFTQNPAPADTPLHGIQVLVVDDEADTLELMSFALQQFGATTIAVNSANKALEELSHAKPDVLISDISMPEQDGYMLIHQVRERETESQAPLPAIALTAHTREEDQKKVLSAGFQAHLAKPIDMNLLAEAIVRLLNHPVELSN